MIPHDPADLALAPVVLALDAHLEHLGTLSPAEVAFQVTLQTNAEPQTGDDRRAGLLEVIAANVEMHGWQAAWDARGLAISHSDRRVVLGLPPSVLSYLDS